MYVSIPLISPVHKTSQKQHEWVCWSKQLQNCKEIFIDFDSYRYRLPKHTSLHTKSPTLISIYHHNWMQAFLSTFSKYCFASGRAKMAVLLACRFTFGWEVYSPSIADVSILYCNAHVKNTFSMLFLTLSISWILFHWAKTTQLWPEGG